MMFATTGWGACMNAACTKAMWIYHVFWTCPAAWQLRKTFITPWKRLGLEGATEEHACFSLELPAVPQAIWELAATSNMQAGCNGVTSNSVSHRSYVGDTSYVAHTSRS
jgi:hypothetical protein